MCVVMIVQVEAIAQPRLGQLRVHQKYHGEKSETVYVKKH